MPLTPEEVAQMPLSFKVGSVAHVRLCAMRDSHEELRKRAEDAERDCLVPGGREALLEACKAAATDLVFGYSGVELIGHEAANLIHAQKARIAELEAKMAGILETAKGFLLEAPFEADMHILFISCGRPISKDNRAYVERYGKARTALADECEKGLKGEEPK